MPGPYAEGQQPASCGCYYPDVVRLRDNKPRKMRTLHCVTHGEYEVPLEDDASMIESPIPTEEWRAAERLRIVTEEHIRLTQGE
ncbi:MAG: hypothetical protein HYY10_00870 [Candidatus Liptonbacteria bacterium]|nr:hypothetical protein [Candidatus Liptonbacteria bacterium]